MLIENNLGSRMPVAWIKSYQFENGERGRVFTTGMGSSQNFENRDMRCLIVNPDYWSLEMKDEQPGPENVEIIGIYDPTSFGLGSS